MPERGADLNGFLVIDKPGGMTSRDVVNRIQTWFPRHTKIGHTGTLDPLATGVLVLCIGAATRLADYVQAMNKSYASRFRLGSTSSTDDAEGVIAESASPSRPTLAEIASSLEAFVGVVQQAPPAISAVKVSGKRAYRLARAGEEVQISARPVRIDAIRIAAYAWPFLDVEVDCGKGTYIRSIARDLGARLGCGGLVQTLRRTHIGPFTPALACAFTDRPDELALIPLKAAVANLHQLTLTDEQSRRFRLGQVIAAPDSPASDASREAEVAILDANGNLVGIAEKTQDMLRPKVVLSLR